MEEQIGDSSLLWESRIGEFFLTVVKPSFFVLQIWDNSYMVAAMKLLLEFLYNVCGDNLPPKRRFLFFVRSLVALNHTPINNVNYFFLCANSMDRVFIENFMAER